MPRHSYRRLFDSKQSQAGSQPIEGATISGGCWLLRNSPLKMVKLFGCCKNTRPPTPATTPNKNARVILMVVRLSPNHGLPTARPAIIASRQDRDVASGKLHRM